MNFNLWLYEIILDPSGRQAPGQPPNSQAPHSQSFSSGYSSGGQMTQVPPNTSSGQLPQRPPGQQQPGGPQQAGPQGAAHPPSSQSIMQQKQSKIAPVAKPQGLNPIDLLNERENRYNAYSYCFSSVVLRSPCRLI